VVVLVSRGSEEHRTRSETIALTLGTRRRDRGPHRSRHATSAASDQISLRHTPATEKDRTVVACVAISTGPSSTLAAVSGSLAGRLGTFVRQDDRICMIGGGRVVVMFQHVDASLNAHVLGARLARSAAQSLEQTAARDARVTVGLAEGDAGTDAFSLTCAAINSVDRTVPDSSSSAPAVVVLSTLAPVAAPHGAPANGYPPKIDRRAAVPFEVERLNGQRLESAARIHSGAVLVVDTAPPSPGIPGPAAEAVTSLVEGIGLTVAATLAPALSVDPSLASLAGSVIRESIALLVVHPGNGTETEDDDSEPFERPAALAQLFRRTGMRVLAVGVGASDIALAECVLQGAESAFALGELPDAISQALMQSNGESARGDTAAVQCDHSTQRADRLGRLLLLTKSERRVLYHLTTGATAIEIAEDLVLSLATVRSHIRSILRKLEVSSQLAAVAIAQGHPARQVETDHDRSLRLSQQAGAFAPQR
jgi:DNA-binding CsgD family transcriptional regulator